MNPMNVVLVGVGGFGNQYVNAMLDHAEEAHLKLVGVIDPNPAVSPRLDELKATGAMIVNTLEEFYNAGGQADLVTISSPIAFHAQQSICALEHGSAVLCEKPAAATIQEAVRMAEAAEKTGLPLAIGYQASYSPASLNAKADIIAGKYGTLRRARVMCSWPRNKEYYDRAGWAGKIGSEETGWVLDSPAENATAHYLHAALFMSGSSIPGCAMPTAVTAELYRAKPTENYDTGFFRVETEENVDVLYMTSHAVPSLIGPMISFEFDNGQIISHNNCGRYFGQVGDGEWNDYGPLAASTKEKLFHVVQSLRDNTPVPCDIRTAMGHLLCINGGQESPEVIVNFPEARIYTIEENNSPVICAQHLQEIMFECFALNLLPSEVPGIEWSKPSRKVDMRNYTHFPTDHCAR